MKVNKSSWHYEFFRAGKLGIFEHLDRNREVHYIDNKTDLCSYTRALLLGGLFVLVEIFMAVVISIMLVDPILSLGFFLGTANGFIPFFGADGAFLVIGTVLYFLMSLVGIAWLKMETKAGQAIKLPESVKNAVAKSDTMSLIKTWYKSFKEKTCVLIEAVD